MTRQPFPVLSRYLSMQALDKDRLIELGIAVKVIGVDGLKSHDSRRHKNDPHLKVSLEYLDAILDYLDQVDIRFYRMSSDLAPYATHPDMPRFHNMVAESDAELAAIGRKARDLSIRLTFHPSQYILINTPDEEVLQKSFNDLQSQADMLDRMGMGPNSVLVTHVGGVYGDREAAIRRWIENYDRLPEPARRRLVLENDDLRFSAADVLRIHEATGVRLIFDIHHHWCFNPEGLDRVEAFGRFLDSWPESQKPKMHFSSPRTEMRTVKRKDRKTGKQMECLQPPVWTGHSDFISPFQFIQFARDTRHLAERRPFDVMLECKSKDLALLRLRADILRYGPDVCDLFGLVPDAVDPDAGELCLDAEAA